MGAPRHRMVLREIESITTHLVGIGLVDDQNSSYENQIGSSRYAIQYHNSGLAASVLGDVSYSEMYKDQQASRAFNFQMLDGALVQMSYEFHRDELIKHRLAFLPSPNLLEYQNNPELYNEEVLYADIVDRRVVTIPLRFDYDSREHIVEELKHPKSHLTMGNYAGCRVPVTAGVTPHAFTDFILRSFYYKAMSTLNTEMPGPVLRFDPCITSLERQVVHVGIPVHL